jgi:hypothetical protein
MHVLFLLIIVDRDEDAYNLTKYAALGDARYDSCDFKETYKSDWIYLTGQDKTEDFYNVYLGHETILEEYHNWYYKLALVALKMKTINDMKGRVSIFIELFSLKKIDK